MRKRVIPFATASSIYDVDVSFLVAQGVKVLLSDLDNTLIPYGESEPSERTMQLASRLKESGITFIICSNGLGSRVSRFSALSGIEAAYFMRKPLAGPLKRLIASKGWKKEEVMLVGDQIMTDVKAANGAGVRCLLTEPFPCHEPPWTRFNRFFEKGKRKKIMEGHLAPSWKELAHE